MPATHHVLFIQGGGQGTHDEWDNKLVDSLRQHLGPDFQVHYPRLPHEDDPSYDAWKRAIETALNALPEDSLVVGHSIGATILLKLLSERSSPPRLAGVHLVAAPFVGDGGWPSDEMRFSADLGASLPPGVPIHFYHGLDDDTAPPPHVELYAHAVPQAKIHRLPRRDHQLNDDLSEVAAELNALLVG